MCMYFMNKSFRLLEDATQLGYNKNLLRKPTKASICQVFFLSRFYLATDVFHIPYKNWKTMASGTPWWSNPHGARRSK